MGTKVQAALEYAELGWPVFPVWWVEGDRCGCGRASCKDQGKHPIGEVCHHGLQDATTDPQQVREWWERFPGAHIGCATGKGAGIDALDIDGALGFSAVEALEAFHGPLPSTPTSRTGGGGAHLLFVHREGLRNRVRVLPGIDVRTTGGYIILPPSGHVSGGVYDWDEEASLETTSIQPWPEWLFVVLQGSNSASSGDKGDATTADVWPEGSRHGAVLEACCALAGTLPNQKQLEAATLGMNERLAQPPLGDREVLGIVEWAWEHRPAGEDPVPESPPPTADDLEYQLRLESSAPPIASNGQDLEEDPPAPQDWCEEHIDAPVHEEGRDGPREMISVPISSLRGEPENHRCYVEGILAPGRVTQAHGPAKLGGKTTFAIAMLHALLRGWRMFAGIPCSEPPPGGHRILIISEEYESDVRANMEHFGFQFDGSDDDRVRVIHRDMSRLVLDLPSFLRALEVDVQTFRPTIVLVDTFAKWGGLIGDTENQSGAVQAAVDGMTRVVCTSAPMEGVRGALMLTHHDSRAGATGHHSQAGRGSTAFLGAVDSLVSVKQAGGNITDIRVSGRLGQPEYAIKLVKDDDGWKFQQAGMGSEKKTNATTKALANLLWSLDWLDSMSAKDPTGFEAWRSGAGLKAHASPDGFWSVREYRSAIKTDGRAVNNQSLDMARRIALGRIEGEQARVEMHERTRSIRLLKHLRGAYQDE